MKCPILNQEAKNLVGLIAKQLESEGFVSTNGSMLDIVELALKTYIQQTTPSSDTTIDYDTWSNGRNVKSEITDYIKIAQLDYKLVQDNLNKKEALVTKDNTVYRVNTPFVLNRELRIALQKLVDFINSSNRVITLSGYAGTGKTSLMLILAENPELINKEIFFTATTNKAAIVLNQKVKKFGKTASTVHKAIGITTEVDENQEYDLNNLVTKITENKINDGVVVIDEASMLNKEHYDIINQVANSANLQIIYLGDEAQLPPVSKNNTHITKENRISPVFQNKDNHEVIRLTKVERTGNNAILQEATNVRNGENLSFKSSFNDKGLGVAFMTPSSNLSIRELISRLIEKAGDDINYFKILAYTNARVDLYNRAVRKLLGYTELTPQVGEILMGYNNWGFKKSNSWDKLAPSYEIIKGNNYKVVNKQPAYTKKLTITDYTTQDQPKDIEIELQATPLALKGDDNNLVTVDYIDIINNETNRKNAILLALNKSALWSLYRRGVKTVLKQINAIDNVLFTNSDIISNGRLLLEKTVDFGYAMTAHKALGSTFNHVVVDYDNIQGHSDEQELTYVALTRASETATIISKKTITEDTPIKYEDLRDKDKQEKSEESIEKPIEVREELRGLQNARQTTSTNTNSILQQVNTRTIADKTEAFGVEISANSKDFMDKVKQGWLDKHPNGIIAFRKNGGTKESFTVETVNSGWIGNPFSINDRGEKTVQQFYDWLVTGNNLNNEFATEEFRQAIIQKILNTPENSPILYYTELGRPSHATVIGYLVNNKLLLRNTISTTSTNTNSLNLNLNTQTQSYKKASEYLDTTPKLQTTKKSVYNVMSGVLVTKRAKNIAMKFLEYMKMLQDQRIEELNTAMLLAKTDKERLNLHNLRIKVLSDFNFLVSTSETNNTEGIVNILNDLKYFYQMLLDTINEALESDKNNTDYQNKKIQLETMLEYWDDMLVEAIPMINDLTGISITMDYNRTATTKVDSDENPTAEGTEDGGEDTKEHYLKVNRQERVTSSTSKRVRMALALIPKLEFSGTKWRTTRDDLGEIDTINVDLVTTWLLNYFSQATDSDSFMYLLDNIDKYNKSLVVLRNKLLGMTEASEEDIELFNKADNELKKLIKAKYQPDYKLLSDFYSTFRNNKCAMYSLNLSRKEKQINATLVNKEDTLAMYIDLWRDNIENGNNENAEFVLNNIGDDTKTRSLNTDDISALQDKLSNITNQLLKNIKLEFDPTSRQKLINQLYTELYAVLRGIGITIDRQVFRNVVQHSLESTDNQTALSIILQEVTAIYNNLAETEPSKNPYLEALQNDLNTEPDLINLFQNRYINIAKALDSYGMQGVERMFSEGGSQYSSYTKPSFLGTLITMLSKPFYMTTDQWKQKIRERWGSDSFMFNTETGRYRNKILQLITEESGSANRNTLLHKIVLTFEDKDYAKWNEVDYLKVILSSLFRSESIDKQETVTVATPVLSDAASAEFVRLPKLNRETAIEALAEIVKQEFSRILTVKSRKEAKKQGEKINEINVYDSGRGEKFCFIPALNNYQVEVDGNTYSFINALELLNKPNLASQFNDSITNAIEDCVAKELQDTVKYIGKIGLGDYNELKQVVDKPTAKAISNNDAFIADLAKFITANQGMKDELKPLQDLIDAYYDNTILITEQSEVYKNAVNKLQELAKDSQFDNKKSQKLLNTRMDFSYVDNLNLMLLNHKVYQCNLILIITGDLAQYRTVGDFIKRFKEAHVPENKLYTEAGWDTIKSIDDSGNITTEYEQIGTKQERYITIADRIDNLWEHLKPSYDKAVKLGLMSKQQYEEAKKILSETNVSDGQSFRTLPSYRKVLIMAGKWNDALEMSYYRITHGISNSFDLDILMQAIKPFAFGPLMLLMGDDYTTNIYTQHKNSEAVILAIYSAIVNNRMFDDNLKEITEWAIANDIDVIHFESAVKTGGNKAIDIWSRPDGVSITLLLDQLTSDENGEPDTIRVLDYENCGIVASTPPHFHDKEISVGSQMRRLMFTNLLHLTGADAQVTLRDGQTYTYRELKEKHDNLIIENLKQSYSEVYSIFKDNKKLSNELIKQIQTSSRYDNDLIEYCKLDENGNFNFPFTEPSQCERIQQLFNSILKKRVTQQKMKGGTLIQLSCVFSRDLQIVTDENTGAIKYFECYAPAYMKDLFSPFIRKDASGRQYVNMNDIPDECRRIIGYRVPTESQYSMAPLYIKDFLPVEYGTSIVLPAEITSIAGSDFDIDKLYCLLPDIEITEKKIRSKYAEYRKLQEAKKAKIKSMHDFIVEQGYTMQMFKADINETDEKKLRRDRNNQLFEIYWGVLTSPSAAGLILNPGNFNIIKRASNLWNIINSGTKLTWDLMQTMSDKEIKEMSDNAQLTQDVTDIRTQLYMQQQNMVGKNMIALSAVHSVNYALRQGVEGVIKVNEKLLPMPLLFGHHYNQLNAVKNDQQSLISRIVASFIPASTDVAKDPSLANLNMNETTGNLILTMAELGYTPTEIMIFMHLPSIQKILNRARFVGIRKAIDESAGRLMSDTSNLATVIDSDTLVRNIQEGREDLEVIKAFLSLYTLADNMSAIIKTERCDSSKNAAGPYMSDNIVAMSLASYVASKKYPITNMKWINEKASTEEEIKQSPVPMLQAFFTYGIAKTEELFANMFYQNSRFAETLISGLSKDSSVQGIISKPLAKKAMEHYMTYRLSLYKAFGLGSMDARIDFVKKFPKLLQAFKDKYPDLASMSFLQQLQTVKKYNARKSMCMDVVAFKHSGMLTKSLKQQYKNQWAALLNLNSDDVKKNQQARNLAFALMQYNYIISGLNFNNMSFMHLCPIQVKEQFVDKETGLSYKEMLYAILNDITTQSKAVENSATVNDFILQFALNNTNSEMWKVFNSSTETNMLFENKKYADVIPFADILDIDETYNNEILKDENEGIPYQYIKIIDNKGKSYLYTIDNYNYDTPVYVKVKSLNEDGLYLNYMYEGLTQSTENAGTLVDPETAPDTNSDSNNMIGQDSGEFGVDASASLTTTDTGDDFMELVTFSAKQSEALEKVNTLIGNGAEEYQASLNKLISQLEADNDLMANGQPTPTKEQNACK